MKIVGPCAHWIAVLCFAVTPALLAAQTPPRTVAMTFDDLPHVPNDGPNAGPPSLAVATESNRRILAALKRYRAPATGFVNERHIRAIGPGAERLLGGWNRGEYELANHGANHIDANTLDVAEIEREIVEGETTIRPLAERAGRKVRFFRFPFNHRGETADKQAAVQAVLTGRGYKLAASTIDTSDYVYDAAFQRALREGDRSMQGRIKRAYLDHTAKQITYYAGLNRQVLGEEVPAIMLLHVNRINAATMEAQLELFRRAGYRFVSLAEAQAHPVYAEPPRGATKFGPMWGYRWARDRQVKFDGRFEEEPPAWIVDYGAGQAP